MNKDEFKKFLREFMYPHECEYEKGHYGDLNHVRFEDVKDDPGGVTKWGIDYRAHRSIGIQGIKDLTIDQADEIYWKEWNQYDAPELEAKLAMAYFDCQINAGPGRAKQFLAKAKTVKTYLDEREAWYKRLVEAKPSSKKFLKGWLARVNDLRHYLA